MRTLVAACALGVLGSSLLLADAVHRPALYPLVAGIVIMTALVVRISNRDGRVPVLDVGAFAVLTAGIYTTVPLVNFAGGGFKWLSLSDNRLQVWGGTPDEVGVFAWRGIVYLAALTASYLALRRAMPQALPRPDTPRHLLPIVSAALLTALMAFFLLQMWYGVASGGSYAQLDIQQEVRRAAPLAVQQVGHNLVGIAFVFKLALLLLLMERWSQPRWRTALIVWLAAETAVGLSQLGARTQVVQLWLAAVFAYHRLVRPLNMQVAFGAGAVLLLAAVGYGLARDAAYARLERGISRPAPILSATNEFQTIFATGYDIHQRQIDGTLDVPPALRFRELYQVVPSQLLPFYKWDAGEWYVNVINQQGKGTGYLFGVVSQALIGWDWIELVLRGLVLGVVCALLQRWYVRQARNWWVMLSYVFVCLWIYYTFRDTTFAPAYFIAYRLLPAIVILRVTVALRARVAALRLRLV